MDDYARIVTCASCGQLFDKMLNGDRKEDRHGNDFCNFTCWENYYSGEQQRLPLRLATYSVLALLAFGSAGGDAIAQERGRLVPIQNRMFCESVEAVQQFAEFAFALPQDTGIVTALRDAKESGINCWVASGYVMYQEVAGTFEVTAGHRVLEATVVRFSAPDGTSIFSWTMEEVGERV